MTPRGSRSVALLLLLLTAAPRAEQFPPQQEDRMVQHSGLVTAGLILGSIASCARLPDAASPPLGPLARETLPDSASLPAAWGAVIGLSPGSTPATTRLWLQDTAATLRVVVYDSRNTRLWGQAVVIPRR